MLTFSGHIFIFKGVAAPGIVAVVVVIEITVEPNNEFSHKRPNIGVLRFSQLKG
jgi:hypothetical protein